MVRAVFLLALALVATHTLAEDPRPEGESLDWPEDSPGATGPSHTTGFPKDLKDSNGGSAGVTGTGGYLGGPATILHISERGIAKISALLGISGTTGTNKVTNKKEASTEGKSEGASGLPPSPFSVDGVVQGHSGGAEEWPADSPGATGPSTTRGSPMDQVVAGRKGKSGFLGGPNLIQHISDRAIKRYTALLKGGNKVLEEGTTGASGAGSSATSTKEARKKMNAAVDAAAAGEAGASPALLLQVKGRVARAARRLEMKKFARDQDPKSILANSGAQVQANHENQIRLKGVLEETNKDVVHVEKFLREVNVAAATSSEKKGYYRLGEASTNLPVASCRDIPDATYGDPAGTCAEHGYAVECLSCRGLMSFKVKKAGTCDQRTTHCYFKSKGETCVGLSQCPYEDEVKAKRGCGFSCKADADCNAPCGVCDKGYCQAQWRTLKQ